jgi:uncharacterized membrane protein YhhN
VGNFFNALIAYTNMAATVFIYIVFILFAVAHLFGEICILFQKSYGKIIRFITKPFLMPLLVVYYILMVPQINGWVIAGLIGGFSGDVFLMLKPPEEAKLTLKLGLISFLLGHICYIVVLIQLATGFQDYRWWSAFLIIPFVLYAVIITPILIKHTGLMTIPVVVYIAVIILMGISTTFLWGAVKVSSVIVLTIGAWLFIISDTINAYNRFVQKIKAERLFTMSTYILAQVLIIIGIILAVT